MREKRSGYVIPRWAGQSASDWYPWLCAREEWHFVAMPNPLQPTPGVWSRRISETFDGIEEIDTIIAHSVGVHALFLSLLEREAPLSVRQVIAVGAWWEVSRAHWGAIGMAWEALAPWIRYPCEDAKLCRCVEQFRLVVSTDDPFVDEWSKNIKEWQTRLQAEVLLVPKGGHFNGTQLSALLPWLELHEE